MAADSSGQGSYSGMGQSEGWHTDPQAQGSRNVREGLSLKDKDTWLLNSLIVRPGHH